MATVYYPPVYHGSVAYPYHEPVALVPNGYRHISPGRHHQHDHQPPQVQMGSHSHHLRRHNHSQSLCDNVYPQQPQQPQQPLPNINPGSYRPMYAAHNSSQMGPYYYGHVPRYANKPPLMFNAGTSLGTPAPAVSVAQPSMAPNGTYWQQQQQQLPQPQQILPPPSQQPSIAPVAPPPVATILEPVKEVAPAPTGGVAASLDYDFADMAEFLATMGCGILVSQKQSSQAVVEGQWSSSSHMAYLQQFLIQVLSATRLPRSTIILGLVYMSKRWAVTGLNTGDVPSTDVVYKMIIVGLILANKFHDDNTFTNQSWGKATQFPIKDLTGFEARWLSDIKWSLHLSHNDNIAWHKWDDCWQLYVKSKSLDTSASYGLPLSPESVASSDSGLPYMSSPGLSGSSATSPFPCEPLSPTHQRSYTIPKWYETANKGVDPVVSHFQQAQASQVPQMAPQIGAHIGGQTRSHVQSHGPLRYGYPAASRGLVPSGSMPAAPYENAYYSQGNVDACYCNNSGFGRPTDWFSVAAC